MIEKKALVPEGTFACPICGVDTPHPHHPAAEAAWRDDQIRRDGWTSALILPRKTGFYLAIGHKITAHDDEVILRVIREREVVVSELGRLEGMKPFGAPPEVLCFDLMANGFCLTFAPSLRLHGTNRRYFVQPTHWRDLPNPPTMAVPPVSVTRKETP